MYISKPCIFQTIDGTSGILKLLSTKADFSNRHDRFIGWFLTPLSAISWRPVLVVEEAEVPGEKHRPWASSW